MKPLAVLSDPTSIARYLASVVTLLTSGCVGEIGPASACDLEGPTEGETDWARYAEPLGTVRGVLLYLDFPDARAADSKTTERTDGSIRAAENYYAESSYGQLTLEIESHDEWLTLSGDSTEYLTPEGEVDIGKLVAEAVAKADGTVDFSGISIVYVLPTADFPDRARAYNPGGLGAAYADGVALTRFVVLRGLDGGSAHVSSSSLVHETGHNFGLPDLYREDPPQFEFAGGWDPMSMGAWSPDFLAWHKRKLGWLDRDQSVCVTQGEWEGELTPIAEPGGLKLVAVRIGDATALVIERRQAVAGRIADHDLCEEGILIYRVDGETPSRQGPILVRPSEAAPAAGCGPLSLAPWQAGEVLVDPGSGVRVEVLADRVRVVAP